MVLKDVGEDWYWGCPRSRVKRKPKKGGNFRSIGRKESSENEKDGLSFNANYGDVGGLCHNGLDLKDAEWLF
jgi:hypothetical protein